MVKEDVFESLKIELEITEGDKFNSTLLESKINAAYEDVKMARCYPSSYADAAIIADMERYYSAIRSIALFDYNQVGAEGQSSYSADGTSIHYLSRDKLFKGVLPIGDIL